MFLGQLADSLKSPLKEFDVSTQNADGRAVAIAYINRSTKWIYKEYPWEYRRKTSEFVQIPNYTTGTCSTAKFDGTNEFAARTVNFSQVLPSGLAGRFFQADGESDWHRILYTTGLTAYLESPVSITPNSSAFKIWKRFYYLPSNVDVVMTVGKWDGRGRLAYHDAQGLSDLVISPYQDGSPTDFAPFGDDEFAQAYATGSITVAANDNVVTGLGTAWVGNVFSGDIFIVGTSYYRVKRVETDTRIILHNYIKAGIAAGTTYSAKKEISLGLQLFPNENNYRVIPYVYLDKHFDMVHETLDRPNLPDAFDEAILSRAEMMILKDRDNARWTSVFQLLSNQLDELKSTGRVVKPKSQQFAPNQTGMPGRS